MYKDDAGERAGMLAGDLLRLPLAAAPPVVLVDMVRHRPRRVHGDQDLVWRSSVSYSTACLPSPDSARHGAGLLEAAQEHPPGGCTSPTQAEGLYWFFASSSAR